MLQQLTKKFTKINTIDYALYNYVVLRQQNFCRREWYVCVEQRVFCRKMSGDDDDHAQRQVECRQMGTSVLLT